MATPPESPVEEHAYELEPSRTPKPIPVALEELCRQTKFSKQEIRVMYRGFKTECPEGVVQEESFKDIYAKFFPHGNSALYAHYVFKAFDVNCSGAISFRNLIQIPRVPTVILFKSVALTTWHAHAWPSASLLLNGQYCQLLPTGVYLSIRLDHHGLPDEFLQIYLWITELLVTLSTLLRGSVYERLRWAFRLYDVDGDGAITRQELAEVVVAVHELLGRRAPQGSPAARLDDAKANEQVDRVFRKLDLNQDGVITIEEFLESCLKDDVITRSLQMFDTGL